MAYDYNATHVLQKIIQCIPEERRILLNDIILTNIKQLALNSNGICLVKKFIGTNVLPQNKIKIRKVVNDVTEQYFICPKCKRKYTIAYYDTEINENIKK